MAHSRFFVLYTLTLILSKSLAILCSMKYARWIFIFVLMSYVVGLVSVMFSKSNIIARNIFSLGSTAIYVITPVLFLFWVMVMIARSRNMENKDTWDKYEQRSKFLLFWFLAFFISALFISFIYFAFYCDLITICQS